MKKYDIILIDGSSYLFRAYHALPPLLNAEGVPTGAIYGVVNMIKRLVKDHKDSKIIVVFDPKGKTFRHELYEDYKADRGETPNDLIVQIPLVQEAIRAMGFPLLVMPGYEADDVIASLVAMRGDKRVLISTLDKDLAQLVAEDVHIINTMHNKLLDPEAVQEKFGVGPHQIRDYLALMGDRSDNIPGITGVGPKTAAKWLNLYGDIEGIKAHQNEIKGKVGERLREEIIYIDLSRQLVELVSTLDIAETLDAIQGEAVDTQTLQSFFQQLGFKRWSNELTEDIDVPFAQVQRPEALPRFIQRIHAAESVIIAWEAEKDQHPLKEINAFSLRVGEQIVVLDSEFVDLPAFWREAVSALTKKKVIAFDIKTLINYLALIGVSLDAECFDIMLAGYILDSAKAITLEGLVSQYLSKGAKDSKEDLLAKRLAKHAYNIFNIYPVLEKRLSDEQVKIFNTLEMPLMKILAAMEQVGVYVDRQALTNYSQELAKRIQEIEKDIFTSVGEEFNISSTKQLRGILFDKLGLPVIAKTPGGEPSTAEATLLQLEPEHGIISLLLQHRTLSKINSTYAEALPKQIAVTGRIHGRFNQAVTTTGRLSSVNPNLQNIPIRTEAGRRIRSSFIAESGYTLISADYSQIELRIMAHYSGDQGLLDAFAKGEDIHSATAARVDSIPLHEVSEEQRRRAKAVNFGLIYGMSAFGLSKQLGIGRGEAQTLIDRYFSQYPGVLSYMETIRQEAEDKGAVATLLGRNLRVPGAKSNNPIEKKAAMRAAINAPMQGTAADIIKLAMIAISDACQDFDYKMTLQVHDELIFEVKVDQADAFKQKVTTLMQEVFSLKVPLVVNANIGENWEKTH